MILFSDKNKMSGFLSMRTLLLFLLMIVAVSASRAGYPSLYDNYRFDAPNTIYIGTQPLYHPTGLIIEVLRRDEILSEQLKEQGISIELFDFLTGQDINDYMAKGLLQGGVGGDMPALTAAAEQGARPISIMQYGMSSLMSNKYTRIEDLAGGKVGVALGSTAHYILLEVLEIAAIDESRAPQFMAMDVIDMPDALASNEIDAYIAWEPIPHMGALQYSNQTDIFRGLTSGYLYLSEGFYNDQPQLVKNLLAAQYRAMAWIRKTRANLLQASQWALQRMRGLCDNHCELLTVEAIADLANEDILGIRGKPLIPTQMLADGGPLHREFQFLQDQGFVDKGVSWLSVMEHFDRVLAQQVEQRLHLQKMKATAESQYE